MAKWQKSWKISFLFVGSLPQLIHILMVCIVWKICPDPCWENPVQSWSTLTVFPTRILDRTTNIVSGHFWVNSTLSRINTMDRITLAMHDTVWHWLIISQYYTYNKSSGLLRDMGILSQDYFIHQKQEKCPIKQRCQCHYRTEWESMYQI